MPVLASSAVIAQEFSGASISSSVITIYGVGHGRPYAIRDINQNNVICDVATTDDVIIDVSGLSLPMAGYIVVYTLQGLSASPWCFLKVNQIYGGDIYRVIRTNTYNPPVLQGKITTRVDGAKKLLTPSQIVSLINQGKDVEVIGDSV